jgi:hypothetical protein
MKKSLVLFIIGFIFLGSCSNNKRDIIGTWIDNDWGQRWSFQSNGDFSQSVLGNGNYEITGDELIISTSRGSITFEIFFSGKNNLVLYTKNSNLRGVWAAPTYMLIKN